MTLASPIPERIGRYLVIDLLGRGGLGEVFLAQRDGDSRLCALKRLLPQALAKPSAVARIRREAHVAALLDHPNIAQVYDAGPDGETFYVASEYVPGKDIAAILRALADRGERLDPRYALAVAAGVLDALVHAHDATDADGEPLALVHRDLSTRNVMISFAGQVKVIDFGIARATVDEHRTATGVIIGTPQFLSPEQAQGERVDRRADLYSLSAVLFEMLAGRRLVAGSTPVQILREVILTDAPPISSLVEGLPDALEAALAKGLEKDKQQRHASASAYLEALAPAVERIGAATPEEIGALVRSLFPDDERLAAEKIRAARERFTDRAGDVVSNETTRAAFWEATVARPASVDVPPARDRRRARRPPALAAVLLLVAGALATFAGVQRFSPPRPAGEKRAAPVRPGVTPKATARPIDPGREKRRPVGPAPARARRIRPVRAARPKTGAKAKRVERSQPESVSEVERLRRRARVLRGRAGPGDDRVQQLLEDLRRIARRDGVARATVAIDGARRCAAGLCAGDEEIWLNVDEALRALSRPQR